MVVVSIALATICFAGQCYPILVGTDTPVGEFRMNQRITSQPGYGGDVLQFKETSDSWYAIHRVWTLKPEEQRAKRLASPDPADRRTITKGCINVTPEVYEKLRGCCSREVLIVTP